MPKRNLLSLLLGGWLLLAGCPGPLLPDPHAIAVETTIRGVAPLNAKLGHEGGKVVAYIHDPTEWDDGNTVEGVNGCAPCKAIETDTDERGHFEIKMSAAKGRITLEASGGDYIEPASGRLVHHQGQKLRAAIPDVTQFKIHEVAITPWTEIAYGRGGVDGYDDALRLLTETFTCNDVDHADVFKVPPALPEDGIHGLNGPSELAYVYMGAFSRLADDLSDAHGVQPGARIGSLRLAKVLAADFANGDIDGKGSKGETVYLFENVALPADMLRQQLAQSTRRFLRSHKPANAMASWGNESTLGESAVLSFLHCICDSQEKALGPTNGGALDVDGPGLAIVAPEPESYLATSQDILCEARDPSGVALLDVVFLNDNDEVVTKARGVLTTHGEGSVRRVAAPLRIEELPTGRLRARCDATDAWDNSSSLTTSFFVNRGAVSPVLTVDGSALDAENHLQGRATITCDCSSDPYSIGCALKATLAGADVTRNLEVSEEGPRKNIYVWDTKTGLDGPGVLECANVTRGLPRPVVQSQRVSVKNYEDGSAQGAVFLDTRVLNMQVVAFAYQDGAQGARLGGGAVDANGRFDFPMSTEYRGPVLLIASYASNARIMATYHNVPLDDANMSTKVVLKLLVDKYSPGEHLAGLSLNVGSSMHEALAVALWRNGVEPTFEAAAKRAYDAVSLYLSVGTGRALDPRTTWVADLTSKKRRSADEEFMGLFHVGLSRRALELSLEKCAYDRQLTVDDIVAAMREDLADGVLDGKQLGGAPVLMACNVPLTPDFFRIDLARAIRNWVDGVAHPEGGPKPVNKSGLTKEAVTSRAPIVQGLANNTSPLFAGRPGENFDGNSPTIWYEMRGPDQKPVDLGKPFGTTTLQLVVRASHDVSRIASLTVTLNGDEQRKQNPGADVGSGEYVIDTATLSGRQILVIKATDAQRSTPASVPIEFTVDRLAPVVTLNSVTAWTRDGNSYRVAGSVAKPNTTARVTLDSNLVGGPVQLEGNAFSLDVPMDCNATHTVRVDVVDAAGNAHGQAQTVHCDNTPPTIAQLPSPYAQAQDGNIIELGFRVHDDPNTFKLVEAENANVLQVQWDRFDNWAENALPALNFAIGDQGLAVVGAPTGALRVAYKYIFRGGGIQRERDWTPLQCTSQGRCAVSISYQAMLPDDILQQPVNIARRQNFIAYSGINDLHSVLLKVEDLAGNVTIVEWTTRLEMFSAPIQMTSCRSSKENLEKLALHQLGNIYAGSSPIFTGRVTWGTQRPPESLTPDGRLDLAIEGTVKSKIERVAHVYREVPHGTAHERAHSAALRCVDKCTHNNVGFAVGWEDDVCRMRQGFSDFPYEHRSKDGQSSTQRVTFVTDRGGSNSNASLNSAESFEFSARVSEQLSHDEKPVAWVTQKAVDGTDSVLLGELLGVELHKRRSDNWAGWQDHKDFARQTLLSALRLEQAPITVSVQSLHGGTPRPVAVKRDDSCGRTGSVRWELGMSKPTFGGQWASE